MVCLGCFFFSPKSTSISPSQGGETVFVVLCVCNTRPGYFLQSTRVVVFFVKQSWATSLWLINIICFARELGQIIVICNQLFSPPFPIMENLFFWEMSCWEGWFLELEQEPPLLQAAVLAVPWTPASLSNIRTGLPEGTTAHHHCCGDTSQLLVGGKSLQDASKIKTADEAEPTPSPHPPSPCSSPPLFNESLFRLVFLASINPNSNYYFPYLFLPALAALLEAECIFSIGSQSRGCIPGLWYMEHHGTPANKGPNSLYIPMVLWMACPAQSLQRCQTARRIGVYVSFQSFTNTLLICGLSWPLRELSSYKMEWFFFFKKKKGKAPVHFVCFIICLFIIFLFEMSGFLHTALGCSLCTWKTPKALTMMNTFKLCSTCLQKSPFGSTSKAFFSPPAQWYIHASSHYSEIWSITLLEPTTIQSKTLCFICYYRLLFFPLFFPHF